MSCDNAKLAPNGKERILWARSVRIRNDYVTGENQVMNRIVLLNLKGKEGDCSGCKKEEFSICNSVQRGYLVPYGVCSFLWQGCS